jgi:molybdate/tungstate transport system substrate-binding protein
VTPRLDRGAAATRDASPPPHPPAHGPRDPVRRPAGLTATAVVLLLSVILLTAACSNGSDSAGGGSGKTSIRVLYAGSLIVPFADLEKQFEAQHPGIDVRGEAHGSIQVLRHVSDIHEMADVLISADSQLIPMLLYDTSDPQTGEPYADWRIDFASNQMAVAYTDKSKYASEITSGNWHDVITRPDVRLGLADPRFDSNGYRALMMFALAGEQYDKPTLFFDTFEGQFTTPITADEQGDQIVIHVPEILETTSDAHIVMRGYSVQLLPLLESGNVDYAIEYLSVIKQHGLKYVTLPPEVNLGDETRGDVYHHVRVDLEYRRFASVKPSFEGQVITYSLTIPSNSAHPDAARLFVEFLLGPDGRRIMEQSYHPMFSTPRCDNLEAVPTELKTLCVPSS